LQEENITGKKIIIDTDPGQDDAVAILIALASPEIEVLGISCVAGNVEVDLTTLNALKICELAGKPKTLVFSGAEKPYKRNLVTAKHVHGKTGIDGVDLPNPKMQIEKTHAVDFIIDSLMSSNTNEISLCALGPLTNLALAMNKEPKIIPKIDKIVLMGGGFFEGGNITPAAEFNIFVDPEAASMVLNSGVEIVMIPLDCTHKVLSTSSFVDKVLKFDSKTGNAVAGLLNFFGRYDSEKYGSDGAPLHDPNVILYLLRPDYYIGRKINVEIELKSELTLGMTVADWWQVTKKKKNVNFIKDVQVEAVLDLMLSRLSTLP
jgi:purine nucleosidase